MKFQHIRNLLFSRNTQGRILRTYNPVGWFWSKATVTKVRTNDEFVRISLFVRIPQFVEIRKDSQMGHNFLRSSYEVRTNAF